MVPQLDWMEYSIDSWRAGLGALTVIIIRMDYSGKYVVRSQWHPFAESVSDNLSDAKLTGERMIYLEVARMAQQVGILERDFLHEEITSD